MLIKATRITNLTDARYFAAREVRFLGFNLEEGTEGFVDPSFLHAMREWVEGPLIVGEFSSAPVEVVREAASFYRLDGVQVSATHHLRDLAALQGLTVLLVLPEGISPQSAAVLMQQALPYTDFFVVPMPVAATTDAILSAWSDLAKQYPLLLNTDADADQLDMLLARIQPEGLSLAGGEEERVGVKSFDQLEEIFERLEDAGRL